MITELRLYSFESLPHPYAKANCRSFEPLLVSKLRQFVIFTDYDFERLLERLLNDNFDCLEYAVLRIRVDVARRTALSDDQQKIATVSAKGVVEGIKKRNN